MISKILQGEWGIWPPLLMTAVVIAVSIAVAFR